MGRLFDGDIPVSYASWADVYAVFENVVRGFINYPWLGWSEEHWEESVLEAKRIWLSNEPEEMILYM